MLVLGLSLVVTGFLLGLLVRCWHFLTHFCVSMQMLLVEWDLKVRTVLCPGKSSLVDLSE
jgi:hypothetical protein